MRNSVPTVSKAPLVIPPFFKIALKVRPGGPRRFNQINAACIKFESKGLVCADQSLNIERSMAVLNGQSYLKGSVTEKIRMHFKDIHETFYLSQILSHGDIQKLERHFIFFLNSSLSPEEQDYLLLTVRTLHCRLIEGFPPQVVASRYGNNYLRGGKSGINELENFKALFREVGGSKLENTSESFNLLYKKIDWAILCYLTKATDLDPSFDSKPFPVILGDQTRPRKSRKDRYYQSCLSPFIRVGRFDVKFLAIGTTGVLSVGRFVPAELLRTTFLYELRATLEKTQ